MSLIPDILPRVPSPVRIVDSRLEARAPSGQGQGDAGDVVTAYVDGELPHGLAALRHGLGRGPDPKPPDHAEQAVAAELLALLVTGLQHPVGAGDEQVGATEW